jgi:hypothetical protein
MILNLIFDIVLVKGDHYLTGSSNCRQNGHFDVQGNCTSFFLLNYFMLIL